MLLLLLLASVFLLLPWAGAGEYREMGFRQGHARAEMALSRECAFPSLISLICFNHISQVRLPETSDALKVPV